MIGIVLFFVIMFMIGLAAIVQGTKIVNIVIGAAIFLIVFRYITMEFTDFKYVMTLAAAGGIGGVLLTKKAKTLAFFIFGFIIGVMLAQLVLPLLPSSYPSYVRWAVVLGTALLGGFFVRDVSNVFLAIAVSFFGGYLLSGAAFMLIDQGNNLMAYASSDVVSTMYNVAFLLKDTIVPNYSTYILGASLVCAVAGAVLQKKK